MFIIVTIAVAPRSGFRANSSIAADNPNTCPCVAFSGVKIPPILFAKSTITPSLACPSAAKTFKAFPIANILFATSSPSVVVPKSTFDNLPTFSVTTSTFPPNDSPSAEFKISTDSVNFCKPSAVEIPSCPPMAAIFNNSSNVVLVSKPSSELAKSSTSFASKPDVFAISAFRSDNLLFSSNTDLTAEAAIEAASVTPPVIKPPVTTSPIERNFALRGFTFESKSPMALSIPPSWLWAWLISVSLSRPLLEFFSCALNF